jgi:putative transposase
MAETLQKSRPSYPSDLTDQEWERIEHLIPQPLWVENLQEPLHDAREMLNAIRYRTRTGVAWRSLPHDFPPWQTVARRYYTWRDQGVFDTLHDMLRDEVRIAEGRSRDPTAAILDSQSVKSTDVGGPCGFDAGKKGKGTKAAPARRRAGPAARRGRDARVGAGS